MQANYLYLPDGNKWSEHHSYLKNNYRYTFHPRDLLDDDANEKGLCLIHVPNGLISGHLFYLEKYKKGDNAPSTKWRRWDQMERPHPLEQRNDSLVSNDPEGVTPDACESPPPTHPAIVFLPLVLYLLALIPNLPFA